MPAVSTRLQSSLLRREDADGGDRFVDLQVDWRDEETDELLLRGGGVWDRSRKVFTGATAATALVFRFTAAQIEAARWLAGWIKSYVAGVDYADPDGRGIFSVLLGGGRRGGKTDLLWKFCWTFAMMVPKARVWIVSPAQPETEELAKAIEEGVPRAYIADQLGAPWFRYKLATGANVHLRSGYVPTKLKRGRADVVGLNEAQNISQQTYIHVRAPIADTGGLVVMAANPPDKEIGQWVGDYQEKAISKKIHGRFFAVDPEKNPWVKRNVLTSMAEEMDERTYQIEILGKFLPRADLVFYSYSDDNIRAMPSTKSEVTREHLQQKIGGDGRFVCVIGMDFQRRPHMCANTYRFFTDHLGNVYDWIVDETVVPQGDEGDLSDALLLKGYDPSTCAVVADASGEWQDADRTANNSWDRLRADGWNFLFKPDERMRRNPQIMDRIAVTNARLRAVVLGPSGDIVSVERRLFVDPDCYHTIQTFKKWGKKNDFPDRRSPHAHVGDSISYPLYRLYPRHLNPGGFGAMTYESVGDASRRRDMELI